MKVPFNYLQQKFANAEPVLEQIRELLIRGDFTLGQAVTDFENSFAKLIGVKHAIGVANGTDALRISLKLAGVGPGDEVITGAHSFIASAGAIVELGAVPVLVDMNPNIWALDEAGIEPAITEKTKAILPVHFTGMPAEMDPIMALSKKYRIPVIEDACQAAGATYYGKGCGGIGLAGAFSLHPLKVLNVWGDGGMITTNSDEFAARVRLYRNHGLVDRDTVASFGCNSRLDTLQAIVGNWLINETPEAMRMRRFRAEFYDNELASVVDTMPKRNYARSCYHLYMVQVSSKIRNDLVDYLNKFGVEAKVHYPIPMYKQHCFTTTESFPVADSQCDRMITLPVHEHLDLDQLEYVVGMVRSYFE